MKKKNAFTLIELLVVVAIIGILAAVGVISFSRFTENAKIAVVKSNHITIIKLLSAELKKCEIQGGSIKLKSNPTRAQSNNWRGQVDPTVNNVNCARSSTDTPAFFRAVQDHLNNEGYKNPYNTSEHAFYSTGPAKNGIAVGTYSGREITITSTFTNSSGNLEQIIGKVIDER